MTDTTKTKLEEIRNDVKKAGIEIKEGLTKTEAFQLIKEIKEHKEIKTDKKEELPDY